MFIKMENQLTGKCQLMVASQASGHPWLAAMDNPEREYEKLYVEAGK